MTIRLLQNLGIAFSALLLPAAGAGEGSGGTDRVPVHGRFTVHVLTGQPTFRLDPIALEANTHGERIAYMNNDADWVRGLAIRDQESLPICDERPHPTKCLMPDPYLENLGEEITRDRPWTIGIAPFHIRQGRKVAFATTREISSGVARISVKSFSCENGVITIRVQTRYAESYYDKRYGMISSFSADGTTRQSLIAYTDSPTDQVPKLSIVMLEPETKNVEKDEFSDHLSFSHASVFSSSFTPKC